MGLGEMGGHPISSVSGSLTFGTFFLQTLSKLTQSTLSKVDSTSIALTFVSVLMWTISGRWQNWNGSVNRPSAYNRLTLMMMNSQFQMANHRDWGIMGYNDVIVCVTVINLTNALFGLDRSRLTNLDFWLWTQPIWHDNTATPVTWNRWGMTES